ncbi:hypothetical protein QQ045_032893 [Rhodiola kirilowii]
MPCGVFAYDCGGARMLFDLCFSGLRLWIGFQIGDLCLPIVRCFLLCDGLSFPSTFDSLVPQICEYLTSRSAHAIDITRECSNGLQAIRQGADAVIAVGGDGTLHEVNFLLMFFNLDVQHCMPRLIAMLSQRLHQ